MTAAANERILSTAWKGSDTDPDILARQLQLAESVMLLARGRIADPSASPRPCPATDPCPTTSSAPQPRT